MPWNIRCNAIDVGRLIDIGRGGAFPLKNRGDKAHLSCPRTKKMKCMDMDIMSVVCAITYQTVLIGQTQTGVAMSFFKVVT